MRILIVGGTGFVGTHLAEVLSLDHEVVMISRYPHKFRPEISGVTYIYEGWKEFSFPKFFESSCFDKVLMVGWSGHPRSSNNDLLKYFEDNVIPSLNIIDVVIKKTMADIYFLSSYGALPDLNGGFGTQAISGYAAGKLAVETHLETYSSIFGRRAKSFRLSNPYGIYQDPWGSQGVISIFIGKVLREQPISIFNGTDVAKDYIDVADASKLIIDTLVDCGPIDYSLVAVKSGHNFSVIDILAHINIHLPVLKFVPSAYVDIISECATNLTKCMDQPQNSHHKAFSASIPRMINWIKETN